MSLIDADDLLETLDGVLRCNDMVFEPNNLICNFPNDCKGCKWRETLDFVKRLVKSSETVDAAPVVHGHWIRHDIENDDECSNCHAFTDRALMWCNGIPTRRYEQHHYCPWCGAKMTGDFIYDLETSERIKDGDSDGECKKM